MDDINKTNADECLNDLFDNDKNKEGQDSHQNKQREQTNCNCNDNCDCGTDCKCGDDCNCNDNCTCGTDCDCSDNCKCGDNCGCGADCKCGDDCNCNDNCNDNCTCGTDCKCGDDCNCNDNCNDNCDCGTDCNCPPDCACYTDGECSYESCGCNNPKNKRQEKCQCGCGEDLEDDAECGNFDNRHFDKKDNHNAQDSKADIHNHFDNDKHHFDHSKEFDNHKCECAKQPSDDVFNSLLRLQAEFDNYRKRTEKEKASIYHNGFVDAVTDFLPALDSFKMAKEYITDKNTLVGIDYIEKGILKTLEKMGVTTVDATGKFDPNFHQAIDTSNAEGFEVGDIVKECYKGFKMGDKVIRFSQVIVKR